MSQQIEAGSVLGGRYKVTGSVLLSHDRDQVLDGVDQVLNRPVSILVASEQNAEQLSQSAREVATGERPGAMQVLDLGVSDGLTYLITSHSSAPDLLDLLVATDAPYVEPFFTETLGSEIFGEERSREPETYGGRYDETSGEVIHYDSEQGWTPEDEATRTAPGTQVPAEPARPAPAAPASPATEPVTRAQEPSATEQPAAPEQPKVTVWNDEDHREAEPAPAPETAAFLQQPAASTDRDRREAGHFPAAARGQMLGFETETDDDEDAPAPENRSTRWIVGGVLVVVLIAALIFAVTNLGNLFNGGAPSADKTTTTTAPTATNPGSQPPPSTAPVAAPPAIDSLTRLGDFDFAAGFDKDLPKAIDGNNATYWSNMEFGSENGGGLVKSIPLVERLVAGVFEIPGVRLLGPQGTQDRVALASVSVEGLHAHDVGQFLDEQGILVRVGHHCAQPLHRALGIASSTRASVHVTTTEDEIDRFLDALRGAQRYFGVEVSR